MDIGESGLIYFLYFIHAVFSVISKCLRAEVKILTIFKNPLNFEYKIICPFETWLNNSIHPQKCYATHSVFCWDRSASILGEQDGVGVLIALDGDL